MELIASLFGYILEFLYNICQNYGVAIILFALIVKAIMIPLTIKQQKSMKKTQEMQPKIMALQEKYKDNQEAMMVEYQKLLSENKFNPFGGCLLTFIQLPILLGIFYVAASPLTYMDKMEQTEIDSYVKQMVIEEQYSGDVMAFEAANPGIESTNKAITDYKKINRYYELKIIKENEMLNLDFLGINLGDVAANNKSDFRLLIIPVFTTIFTYLSLYVVSKQNKPQPVKDPDGNEIPMPNMAVMNFMMPLMTGYISYVVPQGMGLYWFTNSLIQIIIQVGMKKFLDEDGKPKVIEGKKK